MKMEAQKVQEKKMTKQSDFKKLQKENEKIRKKIDEILQRHLSTIDDDYSDIKEWIDDLVENELQQEELCK